MYRLQHVGGGACLAALGFLEKDLSQPVAGSYYVLKEPLVSDVDAYLKQIDTINAARNLLEDMVTRRR
jgi:hypothetical protein